MPRPGGKGSGGQANENSTAMNQAGCPGHGWISLLNRVQLRVGELP